MFNSKHYVPILKWKRAEQGALKMLDKKYKDHITPLIQLVMPSVSLYKEVGKKKIRKSPEEIFTEVVLKFKEKRIGKIPEEILQSWGTKPVFLDISLLHEVQFTTQLKVDSMNMIIPKGMNMGLKIIPVIHLHDDQLIKETACLLAKENRSGICLRLISPDFPSLTSDLTELNQNINKLLLSMRLAKGNIDLLVDIKEIGENGDKYMKSLRLSQKLPNLLKWRTFIFASGAFPEDLTKCRFDEENLIPRLDWKNWADLFANEHLQRKPAFADYTIQHPIYKEASQFFHPTTSIKYTLENEWLIMKGKKQKYDKYLASAALLVKDKRFYGKNFSGGDKYIAEKAEHYPEYMKEKDKGRDIKGTGSTETWLRAGINHHLALVAHQVANLP